MAQTARNRPTNSENDNAKIVGGVVLFILGLVAFNAPYLRSFPMLYILEWILLLGGIVGFVFSFGMTETSSIMTGTTPFLISFVLGLIVISHPTISLASLGLLLSLFFVVEGVIRIVFAFITREENQGWSLICGVIILVLGLSIWMRMPANLTIFNSFLGISFMLKGVLLFATTYGLTALSMRGHKTHPA